jgi:hypothetical protein
MIQALGYSVNTFDPGDPGRLCRGRERWIEGFPLDEAPTLSRLVVSGAAFSDDTARDARRGLPFCGLGPGAVIEAIAPGGPVVAFCDQGEPGNMPDEVVLCEIHEQPRYGGRRIDRCVRWRAVVAGPDAIDAHAAAFQPDGFVPGGDRPPPALDEALFLLTGHGDRLALPARRYQASALPDVLAHAPWVALLHADKHGPVLAIYSLAPLPGAPEALERLAASRRLLAVPFSIPPMLARWDRALYELRVRWSPERGDFPVPPGEDRFRTREVRREVVEEE